MEHDLSIFHAVWFALHRRREVNYSYMRLEIVALAYLDDREEHLKSIYECISAHKLDKRQLIVDVRSQFETIAALHEVDHYRLRKAVSSLCDSSELKDLNGFKCIPGRKSFSDSLTKKNSYFSNSLNHILSSRWWLVDITKSYALDAEKQNQFHHLNNARNMRPSEFLQYIEYVIRVLGV